jgi:hypothetical protein
MTTPSAIPAPDMRSGNAEAIRAHLRGAGHPPERVCAEGCRLVVEGSPESGVALMSDLLATLNPRLRFAHGTHDPLNLRIGALQKIPRVVVLRRPFEAISADSIAMRGRLTAAECAQRYIAFHREVARLDYHLVAEHALLVEDMNAVFERINERLPEPLAFSADPAADIARAEERRRARLAAGGGPDLSADERKAVEAEAADEVRAILKRNDEPEALYAVVLSRG